MQSLRFVRLSHLSSLLALLALLVACQGSGRNEGVASMIRHGRYADALEVAREDAAEDPDDEHAQALYRDSQVAFLLDLGRSDVFDRQAEQGLPYFYRAYELDPSNTAVQGWIVKTRRQLAEEWLDKAAELTAPEDLDQAEDAYERVLAYVPDHPDGRQGLSRVLLLKNYRAGLSKTYFNQGINQFRDDWLHPARWYFDVSHRYDPTNDSARNRADQVDLTLAQDRLSQARSLENQGLYNAARNEYRLSLLADPGNFEAQDGLDRMDNETRAHRTIAKAEMSIRRGDYDAADELLAEAGEITDDQVDVLAQLAARIEDQQLAALYVEAQTLERDYRYQEAVKVYDELLELSPYYEDAIARKTTIEEFILLAEEYYTKALDASSDEEALRYLRQIPIIWPEYRDVDERLKAIEQRLADEDPR
jgi:tetratricopeptide (TPR) repeat protein